MDALHVIKILKKSESLLRKPKKELNVFDVSINLKRVLISMSLTMASVANAIRILIVNVKSEQRPRKVVSVLLALKRSRSVGILAC